MRSLQLSEPHWQKGKLVYRSEEMQRVLGMELPAALVIRLPSIQSVEHISHCFTDILAYFPQSGQALIFDYTIKDNRCGINWFNPILDAFPKVDGEPRVNKTGSYKYAVEMSPFLILHSAPCPDKALASFMIDCNASAGVSGIEVLIDYNDKNREKESVAILWFDGSNDYNLEFKTIAKWTPQTTKDSLTWKSKEGMPFSSKLYGIQGYFHEDQDEVLMKNE